MVTTNTISDNISVLNSSNNPGNDTNGKKELREVEYKYIKEIGDILQTEWKRIMSEIDGTTEGRKRFDPEDIAAIEGAYNKKSEEAKRKTNPFKIFVFNWGTMQEWGINGRPAKRRPYISDLLDLCEKVNNIRASNYIRKNLLGQEPENLPLRGPTTGSLEELKLERTIEEYETQNDIIASFPYATLCSITGGFRRLIGKGAFADVFFGTTIPGGHKLAIKNMKKARTKNELLRITKDFDFEVKTFQRLRHPNIIRLYGYSNDNPNEPCLIYPYMKNGTLNKYLKKKENPLTSRQRLKILHGLANAIDYIHNQTRIENGKTQVLVHRDIKPENILLDDDLEPKLADFGLLTFASTGNTVTIPGSRATSSNNEWCGSFAYMAPEAMHACKVSAKGDVWSFGVVLLMIITGLAVKDHPEGHLKEEAEFRYAQKDTEDPILNILHPCWKNDGMIEAGRGIYEVVTDRCLISDATKRADIGDVVADINKLMDTNNL